MHPSSPSPHSIGSIAAFSQPRIAADLNTLAVLMFGWWSGDAGGVSSEDAPKVVSMMHRQLRELPSAAEGFSRVVEVQLDAQHAAVVRTLTALPAADTLASGCLAPIKPKVRSFPTHGQLSAAQGSSTAVSRSDIR